MTTPKPPRAVLYARFSPRPDADTSTSAERQKSALRRWAEATGHEVLGEFEDCGLSGAKVLRPGFEKALKMACAKRCALVATEISRFYRDVFMMARDTERLRERGAYLLTIDGAINTSGAMGEMLAKIFVAIAEYERANKSHVTSEAMIHRQLDGQRVTSPGRLPLGFRIAEWSPSNTESGIPSMMEPDPDERALIMEILRLRHGGRTWDEVDEIMASRARSADGGTMPHRLLRGKPWGNRRACMSAHKAQRNIERGMWGKDAKLELAMLRNPEV